jgi:hypothetical protein
MPGLSPSSLWLDDAWVALVVKADGLGDVLLISITSPGFVVTLAGLFTALGATNPDGPATMHNFELVAQLIPLMAGVAVPVAFYYLTAHHGLHRAAATFGAAILAASPLLAIYSTRVKHYTLDALLAVGLLALAWAVVDSPNDRRRWAYLFVGSVGATAFSAGIGPVAFGAIAGGLVAAWRTRGTGFRLGGLVTLGYAVFGCLWVGLVIMPGTTSELYEYWDGHYIAMGDGLPSALYDFTARLVGLSSWMLLIANPTLGVAVTVAIVAAAFVAIKRRPGIGVASALPVALATVLAAAGLAPLGTGRTDAYLYPGLALVVSLAVHEALQRRDLARGWTARAMLPTVIVAIAIVAITPVTRGLISYPNQDMKPVVGALEEHATPNDRILVYAWGEWAYGLYTRETVRFRPDRTRATGFRLEFDDPRVFVLGPHRDDPDQYRPEVAEAVQHTDRAWLVASHFGQDLDEIEQMLVEQGFRVVSIRDEPGARLMLWQRS